MRKIIEVKYGSHLYGTDTLNSDLDIKGVFLPSREELLSKKHPQNIQNKRPKVHGEKNTKEDVDQEYLSLDRFVKLLCEGQTMALDMLFAPQSNFTEEGLRAYGSADGRIWDELYQNRERFLTKNVTAFVGYARKQAAKYGVKGSRLSAVREVLDLLKKLPPHSKLHEHEDQILKLIEETKAYISMEKTPLVEIVLLQAHENGPMQKYLHCCGRKTPFTNKVLDAIKLYQRTFDEYGSRALLAEKNNGIDWKALSHAVRVNSEAIELLTTGRITLPLPNADLVLRIKKGEMAYSEVATLIERGLADLERARKLSSLRDEPDLAWANEFVAREYKKICGTWPIPPSLNERANSFFSLLSRRLKLWKVIKPVVTNFKRLRWKIKRFFTS